MCFWHADQGKINKLWLVFVSLSFQPAVWACVTLLCHKYCVKLQQFFFKKLFDFLPGIPEPSSNSFRDPIPSLKISANFGLCSCPSFLFINFHRRNKCLLLSSVYYISLLNVSYFLPQRDFALIFFPPNGKKKSNISVRGDLDMVQQYEVAFIWLLQKGSFCYSIQYCIVLSSAGLHNRGEPLC